MFDLLFVLFCGFGRRLFLQDLDVSHQVVCKNFKILSIVNGVGDDSVMRCMLLAIDKGFVNLASLDCQFDRYSMPLTRA